MSVLLDELASIVLLLWGETAEDVDDDLVQVMLFEVVGVVATLLLLDPEVDDCNAVFDWTLVETWSLIYSLGIKMPWPFRHGGGYP